MTHPANSRKLAVAALAAMLGVFAASTPAYAGSRAPAPLVVPVVIGDGPGMLIPLVLQSAELDEAQGVQATDLVEAEGAAIRERLKQIAKLDVELVRLLFADGAAPTAQQLSPVIRRIAALRQEIVDREVAVLLRVRGVLKPEQRTTVRAVNHELLNLIREPSSEVGAGDRR